MAADLAPFFKALENAHANAKDLDSLIAAAKATLEEARRTAEIEMNSLEERINEQRAVVGRLIGIIQSKHVEHATVLASLESLQRRLADGH